MNIMDDIWKQIKAQPEADAIRMPLKTIKFFELGQFIAHYAAYFKKSGLNPGDMVSLEVESELPHLFCSLALASMGVGQYTKVTSDAISSSHIQAVKILKIKCSIVMHLDKPALTDNHVSISQIMQESPKDNVYIDEKVCDKKLPWLARSSSGTTGMPKIFITSHEQGALRRERYFDAISVGKGDCFFSVTPLHYGVTKQRVFYTLSNGGAVAFAPGVAFLALPDFIAHYNITNLYCVPMHLDVFVEAAKKRQQYSNELLFPGIKQLETSSSTVSPQLQKSVRNLLSPNLVIAYSVSEVGHISATSRCNGLEENSVGRILNGVKLEIVNQSHEPVAQGEPGLIRITCPGMLTNYLGGEGQLSSTLEQGWFMPGDRGYLSAKNQLIFLGRADDMMIFNGVNIYPIEIENVLLQHPAIKDAVAFPISSARHQDIPVAAIIPKHPIELAELERYCIKNLGGKKPRLFLMMDEFPKNAMGKTLRRELVSLSLEKIKEKSYV